MYFEGVVGFEASHLISFCKIHLQRHLMLKPLEIARCLIGITVIHGS